MTEKVTAKDMTEFDGPVDTGDSHGKRPADKRKVGDIQPDESVAKSAKKGKDLPGTTTIGEEVAALFDGVDGLSEGFVEKASTIFEGAISEKVSILREEIEAEYNEKLDEAYEVMAEDLENKLDQYINLFVEQYMEDNKVAIESGFRNELAEQVMASVTEIVESAGVHLPEDKVDLAEALIIENEKLEAKYNDSINETVELRNQIKQYQIKEAFTENTAGLTEAAKDKLQKLTENMEFADVETFVRKINILKEEFTSSPSIKSDVVEIAESRETSTVVENPRMAAYIKAARGSFFDTAK